MKINEQHIQLLIVTLMIVAFAFFMFRGFAIFFLPLFIIFPFWAARKFKDSGRNKWFEEEDPADWWKKGKPRE